MAGASFQTIPYDLNKFLDDCHQGVNQLPDFQRSWVWDEDRIKILLESIFKASSVGALKSLNRGGTANFKLSPIEGALNEAKQVDPQSLLLDGQQSITSLYQDTLRGKVVETFTLKKMRFKRWFYIDVHKTLYPTIDREKALAGVPEDRCVRADFGREVMLDLSPPEQDYQSLMYPASQVVN